MIIRRAKETDLNAIIFMGKAMYAESSLQTLAFDVAKCEQWFFRVLTDGLVIVAEHEDKFIGMLGAGITQPEYSRDFVAYDDLVYVVPDYRGTRTAERMLNVYIAWARERGIKEGNISIGINAGINTARIERFYGKLGFKRSGVCMRM
jgi:GNAT superfamily N-acetyltransferase